MLCAHTIRKLKPGTFEEFKEAFRPSEDRPVSGGWVRFHMLRNLANEDEVVTFGFFDGTLEEMEASQTDEYQGRLDAVAPYVESVVSNGVYDIVIEYTPERTTA
jgi:hypothetical protein